MIERLTTSRLVIHATMAVFVVMLTSHAEAGAWTARGAGGRIYSHSSYHNGGGNFGYTNTVSGPRGTATKQFTQTNNGNGTYTDSRTVTRPGDRGYSTSYTN